MTRCNTLCKTSGWPPRSTIDRQAAPLVISSATHRATSAGYALLASSDSAHATLAAWIQLSVDFLVTKHGLAAALRPDNASFETLHAYFLDRLVPVCDQLVAAAADAGEIGSDVTAYELMYGVGNLCVCLDSDSRDDACRLVGLLVAGLRQR
jgi:hypothetical protein